MLRSIFRRYHAAFSGLPRVSWHLAFVAFVNRSGSMVLAFMMLYLTEKKHFTTVAAGHTLLIYGLGSIFGAYLGGWLCDKIGSRFVQLVALTSNGVGLLVLMFMQTALGINLTLLLISITAEALRPANAAAVATFSPPELRLRAFALNRLAVNLGVSFGPALGGFLATVDYSWLFIVDGVTSLCAAVLLVFLVPKTPPETKSSISTNIKTVSPWHDQIFLRAMVFAALIAVVFFQLNSTYPLYLRQHYHFSEQAIGLNFTLNTLIIVAFEMVLVTSLSKYSRLRVIGFGCVWIGGGFMAIKFGNTIPYAMSTIVLWTIGEMLTFATLAGFVAERVSDNQRGAYMGIFSTTFSIAQAGAPFVGTLAYDRWGPHIVWMSCGLIGIVSCIGFWRLATHEPSSLRSAVAPL